MENFMFAFRLPGRSLDSVAAEVVTKTPLVLLCLMSQTHRADVSPSGKIII